MIVPWRNVWNLLRIEPPKVDTTVDGNVGGPMLSGGFQGPVGTGGSVVVNVLTPIPPPAEAPPAEATVGQRIDFMTRALLHIQAAYVEERKERLLRQEINDQRHGEAQKGREWIWRALFLLAIVVTLIGGLMLYMFYRLGWMW